MLFPDQVQPAGQVQPVRPYLRLVIGQVIRLGQGVQGGIQGRHITPVRRDQAKQECRAGRRHRVARSTGNLAGQPLRRGGLIQPVARRGLHQRQSGTYGTAPARQLLPGPGCDSRRLLRLAVTQI